MIRYILFDLDGTLLPMDQEIFVKDYFTRLAKHIGPFGYDTNTLFQNLWKGVGAMVMNDGSVKNEVVFWKVFEQLYGKRVYDDIGLFEEFYRTDFQNTAKVCGYDPEAKRCVDAVKDMGYKVVLATNPIFPAIATESRMRWAGLAPEDFDYYTTYENSCYGKPNLKYYEEILEKIGAKPEECLMVGNDVAEDMVAEKLGMKVFLLTDCIINKHNEDIEKYPHGKFEDLMKFVREL